MTSSSKKSFLGTLMLVLIAFLFSTGMMCATNTEYTIRQLTDNEYDDFWPSMYNGQVLWLSNTNGQSALFSYDGIQSEKISDISIDINYGIEVDNGQMVWLSEFYLLPPNQDVTYKIFLYNGTHVVQIANDVIAYICPLIHNGQCTWSGGRYIGTDYFESINGTQVKILQSVNTV